jgi:hypothetical protein
MEAIDKHPSLLVSDKEKTFHSINYWGLYHTTINRIIIRKVIS